MANCAKCNALLDPGSRSETLCVSCLVAAAGQKTADDATEAAAAVAGQIEAGSARRRRVRVAGAALVACAVLVVARNISVLRAAVTEPKPVRWGTYKTDREADRCIANLWKAYAALQSGGKLELSCPLTGAAYVVEEGPGRKVVRCPNPGRHGLVELRAGGARGVPEAVR
jgi:hypothetical protein